MSVRGEVELSSATTLGFEVRGRLQDYLHLAKVRLSSMVLMAALVGYWLASSGIDRAHLLWFTLGTFLVIAGANAFNQVLERDSDALMERTARRPLPAGRMSPLEATAVAGTMSVVGIGILFARASVACGLLAVVALSTYVLVYTPMKSRSAWSTVPGAIAGAIPPLMGWSAVQGELGPLAWSLFGILFFWQFPHTWAIASAYREDYRNAGYRAFPVEGTRFRTMTATAALVIASFLPVATGLTGLAYMTGALALGAVMIAASVRFGDGTAKVRAIQLLVASLFYLPLLLTVLAFDGKVA